MGLTCLATITESRPENFTRTMGSLTADQLSSQLKLIKKGINEAQLIADDKVVKIFNDLHMPVNSEILELCSETGHVSACMQTRGYFKIDVLNEDMPTLRKMENKNLYRNYIWREVSGIGSTGLREESYDLVVTSGGFSSDAMSPNDITETLRILRPEGYMIILTDQLPRSYRSRLSKCWWMTLILVKPPSSMTTGVRSMMMIWLWWDTIMDMSSVLRHSSSWVWIIRCPFLTLLLELDC